jgi:Recombination endonuclease VII
MLRYCRHCGEKRTPEEFPATGCKCRPCQRKWAKKWRENNKDHVNAQGRMRYKENRDLMVLRAKNYRVGLSPEKKRKIVRRRQLKVRYGITPEQYDEMHKKQKGLCFLCEKVPLTGPLQVDHNHETKKVRKLLCANCNRGLVFIENYPKWLKRALAYLKAHSV